MLGLRLDDRVQLVSTEALGYITAAVSAYLVVALFVGVLYAADVEIDRHQRRPTESELKAEARRAILKTVFWPAVFAYWMSGGIIIGSYALFRFIRWISTP